MITKLKQQLFLPAENRRLGEGGLRMKDFFKGSLKDKPLISIVTIVYNGKENLEQTISSVLNQSYDNIEYIIIDGGSQDGTIDIIKKYDDKIDYWVSEPDAGVYSAMNKGASLCRGKYISFLNADDWYNNDTIELVVQSLNKHDVDYLFGNTDLFDGNKFLYTDKERLAQYKFNTPFGHQSLFVRLQYFLSEPFNTKYKILADYNFMLGLITKELPFSYLNKSIVNYRIGGLSSTANATKEKFDIVYKHFGILRAIYSYLIVTNNPIIKPINTIINKIRSIKKQVKTA